MHFSITRLLLAVSVFSLAFGALSNLGVEGVTVAIWIGLSVGLICLIVKPKQIWPMFRTVICIIAGGVLGTLFCPTPQPPAKSFETECAIIGGFIGFIIGISITALLQVNSNDTDDSDPT